MEGWTLLTAENAKLIPEGSQLMIIVWNTETGKALTSDEIKALPVALTYTIGNGEVKTISDGKTTIAAADVTGDVVVEAKTGSEPVEADKFVLGAITGTPTETVTAAEAKTGKSITFSAEVAKNGTKDATETAKIKWSVETSPATAKVAINETSGVLTIAEGTELDAETTVTVKASYTPTGESEQTKTASFKIAAKAADDTTANTYTISVDVKGYPAGTKFSYTYVDGNKDPQEKTTASATCDVYKNTTAYDVTVKVTLPKTTEETTYVYTYTLTGDTTAKTFTASIATSTSGTKDFTYTIKADRDRTFTLKLTESAQVLLSLKNFTTTSATVYNSDAGDTTPKTMGNDQMKDKAYRPGQTVLKVNTGSVVYVYTVKADVSVGDKYVVNNAVDDNVSVISWGPATTEEATLKIVIPADATGTVAVDAENFQKIVKIRTVGVTISNDGLTPLGTVTEGAFNNYKIAADKTISSLKLTGLAGYAVYAHRLASDTEANTKAVTYAAGTNAFITNKVADNDTYSIGIDAQYAYEFIAVTPVTSMGASLKDGDTKVVDAGNTTPVYVKAGETLTVDGAKGSTMINLSDAATKASTANLVFTAATPVTTIKTGTAKLDLMSVTKVTFGSDVYVRAGDTAAHAAEAANNKAVARDNYVYGLAYIYATNSDTYAKAKNVVVNKIEGQLIYAASKYRSTTTNDIPVAGKVDLNLVSGAIVSGLTANISVEATDGGQKVTLGSSDNNFIALAGAVLTIKADATGLGSTHGHLTATVTKASDTGDPTDVVLDATHEGDGIHSAEGTYTVKTGDLAIAISSK